ncbi:tetratricopeptide repeat protein [Azospirillum sp. TSO5]|uniref:tetratricopeptide repeat protein n=1 Tax=Azospirillum sp. TSO5 TaxID=716760 RepID=UPI000D6597F7|nr:tetratricopeptide repeat protein [Azospirillum sp. TSO5]
MIGPEQSREIRVFLSSTFKDMNAERDHLLTQVFPLVRSRCAERGVGFTEIDLRWGVTEEEAKNGYTVEICLAEIDRCRDYPPFFIGFLGERYGWIPLFEDLVSYWKSRPDSPYRQAIEGALEQRISVTELEMRFGVLDRPEMQEHAHFFLRSPSLTEYLLASTKGGQYDDFFDASGGRLTALKNLLRTSGRIAIDGYADVAAFGDRVQAILLDELDRRFPAEEVGNIFSNRAHAHALFAQARRQGYVPLAGLRDQIGNRVKAHIAGEFSGPLLLRGISGLGKSSLMADLEASLRTGMGAQVIAHYVGADGQHGAEAWRDGVLDRLRSMISELPALPTDDEARWKVMPSWLDQIYRTNGSPVVLLLDAVDQFTGAAEAIQRLGEMLWPAGTALLASATPAVDNDLGVGVWEIVDLRAPKELEIRAIITAFASAYRKILPPKPLEMITRAPQARVPLYLRMLLEYLRVHSRHEGLVNDVEVALTKPDAASLFEFLLKVWDRDYGDELSHFGLASKMAALLAASRQGLSELELADLLAAPKDPLAADSERPRVPKARLAGLLSVLRPYLLRNAGRETLMHTALVRGALPTYVKLSTRQHLLQHFAGAESPALAERVHQRLAILEEGLSTEEIYSKMALAAELFDLPSMIRLWEEDKKLLSRCLTAIGAGNNEIGPEAEMLGQRWLMFSGGSHAIVDQICGNNEILGWFVELSFNNLAEVLCDVIIKIQKYTCDNNYMSLAPPLNYRGMVHYARGDFEGAEKHFAGALEAMREEAIPNLIEVASVLNNISAVYWSQGNFGMAEQSITDSLNICRENLPPDHPDIATRLGNLGAIYIDLHQFDTAEALLKEALDIRRQSLPPGHPDIANSLNSLASLYRSQEKLDIAESLYEEAFDIMRRTLPPGHPSIAYSLNNLALLYEDQGKPKPAERLLQKALNSFRQSLPPEHPGIAATLINLSSLYESRGEFDNAELALQEALLRLRKTFPSGSPKTAITLSNLASLYKKQDKLAAAGMLYNEALNIQRATLPPAHPDIANALRSLADIYRAQNQFDAAEQLYKEAVGILRRVDIAEHTEFASCLNNLAEIYREEKNFDAAEPLYVEALRALRQAPSPYPLEIAHCLNNMGLLYYEKGEMDAAENLCEEALCIRCELLPPDAPELASSFNNLALLYHSQGKLDDAARLYNKALIILRKALPSRRSNILTSIGNLAKVYQQQGKLHAVEPLYEEALTINRQLLPAGDTEIAASLNNLAALRWTLGKFDAIEPLLQEALVILRQALPPEHPSIAAIVNNLEHLNKRHLG